MNSTAGPLDVQILLEMKSVSGTIHMNNLLEYIHNLISVTRSMQLNAILTELRNSANPRSSVSCTISSGLFRLTALFGALTYFSSISRVIRPNGRQRNVITGLYYTSQYACI